MILMLSQKADISARCVGPVKQKEVFHKICMVREDNYQKSTSESVKLCRSNIMYFVGVLIYIQMLPYYKAKGC